jgi:hypothetical protein
MSIIGSNMLAGSSGQAGGGYQISRSLRFNSADSAYLSRTFGSAGNRKTWTWAGWVKRSKSDNYDTEIFGAGTNNLGISFIGDLLNIYEASGSILWLRSSTAVYRDFSAWYHVTIAYDTTQLTEANRVKIYVNGIEITAFSANTSPSLNYDGYVNSATAHYIGLQAVSNRYLNGYLADIHFIDGQALTPSSFGEFDTNGVWQPIDASELTYGTNGFHLPFSDNSTDAALGTDTSGNGNTWTVNNLTAGPAFTSNSWSGYFDGSGDSLTVTNNAVYDFGSGSFTIEGWAYPTTASQLAFAARTQSQGFEGWIVSTTNFLATTNGSSWDVSITFSSALTANSWNHVAIVRNGNVYTAYLNGVANGTTTVSGSIVAGTTVAIIGQRAGQTDYSGYISNFRIVKGTAVYTTAFTPPTTPLTAVSNTSLLTLQSSTLIDNSPNNFTITANGNARVDFRSPFEESIDTDSLVDSPTNYGTDTGAGGEVRGNYATLNPLANGSNVTLSNGNLDYSCASGTNTVATSSIAMSSGKWYCEFTATSANHMFGLYKASVTGNIAYLGVNANGWGYYWTGQKYTNSTGSAYGSSYTTSDVIGVAFDADAGSLYFYKNGAVQNSGTAAFTGLTSGPYVFATGTNDAGTNTAVSNFGQRPFAYTAPSGFKALCTTNLPEPTIADGSTVMDVALYTGNGSTQTISGLNFSPDLVWIKGRSGATDHALYDAVRGVQIDLVSNSTAAETTQTQGLTAFNSDGFSLGTLAKLNTNTATYAGWAWDAGSSTVTNTSGTISAQVRANASAGFSVVTYTGTGADATVGHGLGVAAGLVIVKRRDTAANWQVRHTSIAAASSIQLNLTNAAASATTVWNSTAPSSTVFSVGTDATVNANTATYVAYCFAPVAGYSSFGSYTGNGSTDGPFVYTGFRPKFVLFKAANAAVQDWVIYDTKRDTYNVASQYLFPNASSAEAAFANLDFLSNGFKLRSTISLNTSGYNFIYAAFAEHPFATSRAR